MFHLILFEPEIAPNTGNIIRLCANTGSSLHLIRPLGFTLNDKRLRRAGLDYREYAEVTEHDTLQLCLSHLGQPRLLAISTRGRTVYSDHDYAEGDAILFGPETRGLPQGVLEQVGRDRILRLPMQPSSRSLNLSNTVAVALYEALRQLDFQALD